MSIKAICAMAVFAASLGQAEAATYGARYIETIFGDVRVAELHKEENNEHEYDQLSSSDDPWGLKLFIPGMKSGDIFSLEDIWSSCILDEPMSCGGTGPYDFFDEDPIQFGGEYYYVQFSGPLAAGTRVNLWDIAEYGGHIYFTDDLYVDIRNRNTYFEIVDLAPVPLPATTALLPVGIGALAMMRKRRRPS